MIELEEEYNNVRKLQAVSGVLKLEDAKEEDFCTHDNKILRIYDPEFKYKWD